MSDVSIPDWALKPNAAYREIPGGLANPTEDTTATTWQQLKLQAELWLNVFVGRVAIAFGGINIFGWKPLEFLADWGQQRIDDAIANYQAAMTAQNSANFANSQLAILTGGTLASGVSGGVSVSEQFNGSSANTLGASWTRTSVGPGGGNFGPNGSGRAVWKKSGGLWRRHVDIYNTPLATDYQNVFVVLSSPPQAPFGDDSFTYLLARCNSSAGSFVYCRIGNNDLQVGVMNSGEWSSVQNPTSTSVWQTVAATVNVGDQISFIVGTAASDYEVIVRQNGLVRISYTSTSSASAMGAGFRYAGLASQSGARSFFLDQTVPAELDVWSASDRLPATT